MRDISSFEKGFAGVSLYTDGGLARLHIKGNGAAPSKPWCRPKRAKTQTLLTDIMRAAFHQKLSHRHHSAASCATAIHAALVYDSAMLNCYFLGVFVEEAGGVVPFMEGTSVINLPPEARKAFRQALYFLACNEMARIIYAAHGGFLPEPCAWEHICGCMGVPAAAAITLAQELDDVAKAAKSSGYGSYMHGWLQTTIEYCHNADFMDEYEQERRINTLIAEATNERRLARAA